MNKAGWKRKIKSACQSTGTYAKHFDPVIETLAEILEKRDRAGEEYKRTNEMPVIPYKNKAGATNLVKNPILVIWDELNKSALAYWRDLGLTPAGLKKIDESAIKKKKPNALAQVLKEIGG